MSSTLTTCFSARRTGSIFNGDGKIDPVVGYGKDQAVLQILLSDPNSPVGVVDYISLTLDSKRDMENLADVAVGDIDRDGALDIVAAAEAAVWYYHHPTGQPTTAFTLVGESRFNRRPARTHRRQLLHADRRRTPSHHHPRPLARG